MKAVLLDKNTLGDLDLTPLLSALPELVIYPVTSYDQIISRCREAKIILTNKCMLDAPILKKLTNLKFIQLFATGTDNVDVSYAKSLKIDVKNVSGYSTESVSTYILTTLLNLFTSIPSYIQDVNQGRWENSETFTFLDHPIETISGKTLGIVGYGNIGKRVHEMVGALEMKTLIAKGSRDHYPEKRLSLDELLPLVDVLLISCPLTEKTKNMITKKELALMKPSAYLINAARGSIVNEVDLSDALKNGSLAGAGVDVLGMEPPKKDHPLVTCNHKKLYLTPHMAWAATSAREHLLKKVLQNLDSFMHQMSR